MQWPSLTVTINSLSCTISISSNEVWVFGHVIVETNIDITFANNRCFD